MIILYAAGPPGSDYAHTPDPRGFSRAPTPIGSLVPEPIPHPDPPAPRSAGPPRAHTSAREAPTAAPRAPHARPTHRPRNAHRQPGNIGAPGQPTVHIRQSWIVVTSGAKKAFSGAVAVADVNPAPAILDVVRDPQAQHLTRAQPTVEHQQEDRPVALRPAHRPPRQAATAGSPARRAPSTPATVLLDSSSNCPDESNETHQPCGADRLSR